MTIGDKIGALVAIGFDVPNFINDVPNFVKDVPNFVNDIPRFSKSTPRWETTSNHFPRDSKGRKIGVSLAQGLDVSNFLKDVPRVLRFVSK